MKPFLSSLLVPNFVVSGVSISCSDSISPKLDQLKRNVNTLIHFKVGVNYNQESATIHLHHTQQKVHIQGNAAPWFTEHVLQGPFSSGARNMELSIRNLNSQISSSVPKTNPLGNVAKLCSHCKKQIKQSAKSLSFCGNCCQTFHSTKINPCFLSHICTGPPPGTPTSSLGISVAGVTTTSYTSSGTTSTPEPPPPLDLSAPLLQ